ncbi:hypothetical protein C2W64_04565 [Brevibacillus laterosporus]|nr:hypothetical protein [Brevibacillus laterosporus]RAP17744.1 hypothetical protein C2W64_04565 [Brevibacillus laterosporus]
MAKTVRFSVVIESPQQIEVGSAVKQDGKMLFVTKIKKVEYVTSILVLVSGNATI